jgi:hypothetical protein
MLARNRPLTYTSLRAGALSMIVYCIMYGLAQWLEGGAGYSSAQTGLVMLPLSLVAAVSSLTGARMRGIRAPFLVSIGASLAGCVALYFVDAGTPAWAIAIAVGLFGLGMGMFSTSTQAAVYIQAPAEEIGAAAGLQRTAQYVGSIASTSLLAVIYGASATDSGLHLVAAVMGALSAFVLVATILDRTLPRGRV